MLVGLISDTHDNLKAVEKAVKLFNERGVSKVLHAGDWCAPFTLARFRDLEADLVGVYGNVDGELELLRKRAEELGFHVAGYVCTLDLDGVRTALFHGHLEPFSEAMVRCGLYKLVVRGHTHKPLVRQVGETLVVNPGEACGYLYGNMTVAILDTKTLHVEIVEL